MPTKPATSSTTETPAAVDAGEPLPLNQPAKHGPRQEINVAQPPWVKFINDPLGG